MCDAEETTAASSIDALQEAATAPWLPTAAMLEAGTAQAVDLLLGNIMGADPKQRLQVHVP
jgi:hypothetical protein